MKKHIKFPKIKQYKDVLYDINYLVKELGPITNTVVYGTVKLHGTNRSICLTKDDYWCQSRNQIITQENETYGFASWANNKIDFLRSIIGDIGDGVTVTIFGEWCGKGIQKGVGVSKLEKMFVVFGIKYTGHGCTTWAPVPIINQPDMSLYSTNLFKTYELPFDLTDLNSNLKNIQKLVDEVENECPVSKYFGHDNCIGEGLVFKAFIGGRKFTWKSKGLKHVVCREAKIKIKKEIDPTLVKIAEDMCPPWRLEQTLERTYNGGPLRMELIGGFIKNLKIDIVDEELESFNRDHSDKPFKEVLKLACGCGRDWLLECIEDEKI